MQRSSQARFRQMRNLSQSCTPCFIPKLRAQFSSQIQPCPPPPGFALAVASADKGPWPSPQPRVLPSVSAQSKPENLWEPWRASECWGKAGARRVWHYAPPFSLHLSTDIVRRYLFRNPEWVPRGTPGLPRSVALKASAQVSRPLQNWDRSRGYCPWC